MKNFYNKLIIIFTFSFFLSLILVWAIENILVSQTQVIKFFVLWLIILSFGYFLYFLYIKLFRNGRFPEKFSSDENISYNINEISKIKKIGFWSYDAKTYKLDWSDGAYNIFEYDSSVEELTYEKFLDFLPQPEQQYLHTEFETSIKNNQNYNVVHTIITPLGNKKFVEEYANHYYDEFGNHIKTIGTVIDITEQITSKEKINQERIKYQSLLDLSSEIIYIIDSSGNVIEYSLQALHSLGYTHEQMKNAKVYDWDLYLSEEKLEKICKSEANEPITIQSKHKRSDGTLYDVELLAVKISLNDDHYIYVSARDVTKTNQLTKHLKEQKEEFEAIFNNSKDGIALMDFEMRLLNFNKAYMELTGYSKDELLMKKCTSFTAPEDINRSKVAYDRLMKFGYIENFEKTYIKKDGKRIDINLTISVIKETNQLLMIVKDVSSLKMMEKQSRLASMGEMLGNIAHQWRQPLSVISTSASGLKLKSEFDHEIDQAYLFNTVDTIMEQTKYLSDTIDDFRNFLKGNTGFSAVNINEMITSSINLVRSSMDNNHVNLVVNLDDNLIIQGNASQLQQSIINILNNAKDALVEKNEENDRYIFIKTQKDDELSLNVIIYDNAGGIPENIIQRIFEPYFTTKHKTFGTGLGLSMAHQILVDKHQATIEVYNYQYKYNKKSYSGACFNIGFKIKE